MDGVLLGYGTAGRWTVTPSHWQFDTDDPDTDPRYDPAEARRLLAEAGWVDRDGDGVLEDAQGRPLRFTLHSFREAATHAQSMTVIQSQLRQIGVDVRLRLLEEGSVLAMVEGRLDERGERVRDYDAFLTNWESGVRADDSWFLHSRYRNEPASAPGYADARADALMDTLAMTLDGDAARPLWREYQRLMVRESPVTVLYYAKIIAAVASRLQGVEMDGRGPFLSAQHWWVVPARR